MSWMRRGLSWPAAAFIAAIAGPVPGALAQDVLELAGTRLEGRILYADDVTVVLRQKQRDRRVWREDVAGMHWSRDDLRRLLARAGEAPPRSARASLELARFARAHGLTGEARVLAWQALLADPESAEAHEALGHVRGGGGWQMTHDRRRYRDLDDLRAAAREWRHAHELSTLHFRLKTNLDLDRAVAAALDLERLYLALYDLFSRDLGLYECTEPMGVEIHADARSYPEPASGAPGYFDPGPNVLFLSAEPVLDRRLVAHEITHQVLHNAVVRDKAFSGDLPAWVDEGLAQYVAAAVTAAPGSGTLDPGRPRADLFARHAAADDPLSLARVLALASADFQANSRAELMYAQSYTLVHWALHADEGAHRAAFFEFLRACFRGRSSPSRFKEDLGLGPDFEARWREYARGLAG